MKIILQVLLLALVCAEIPGTVQAQDRKSPDSDAADSVAQRIFRDRKDKEKGPSVKYPLKLTVAELEEIRRPGTSVEKLTQVLGRCNLRSIPDDDILVLFYRIQIEGEERQGFLEKSGLPDVMEYSIVLVTQKDHLTRSHLHPAPVFPNKNMPNQPLQGTPEKAPSSSTEPEARRP